MGAHHFFAFLRAQGMVSAFAVAAPSSPPPTLLTAFEPWRDVHRGVTAQTLRNYRPIRLDVLTTFEERPEQLEAKSLRAFILARAHRHGKGHAKKVVTATRMFVRFLIAHGHCAPGLDAAIPTIAMWRLATLPQSLPAEDVERILTACDPSTPLGARDQAIIVLMAR
jgi:site-specific recombinase XerC